MHQIARPEPAVLLWTQTSEQTLLLWPRVFHKSTAIWLDSGSEVWAALALLCKEVTRSHLRDDQLQTRVFTDKCCSNSSAVNSKASWVPFTPFDAWDTSPSTIRSGLVRMQRSYDFSTTLLFGLPAGSRVCWASTQTKEVRTSTTEPGACITAPYGHTSPWPRLVDYATHTMQNCSLAMASVTRWLHRVTALSFFGTRTQRRAMKSLRSFSKSFALNHLV